MRVLLLNGSRRKNGCTYTALQEVAGVLNKEGIETEIMHAVPDKAVVAEAAEKLKEADGVVFMDLLSAVGGNYLRHKPAAAIASARRAGTSATLDVLYKYLAYHESLIVSSNYWNMVHGNTPDEVRQDAEGLQIMKVLGTNMVWALRCVEAGKKAGVEVPQTPQKIYTNFIR